MRPIKFRAWVKEAKCMLYSGIHDRNWYATPYNDLKGCHCIQGKRPEDRNTLELMQYTGLEDKNDKDIYEGDVVNCFTKYSGWQVCKVEYQESDIAFGFTMKDGSYLVMDDTEKEFEVIGNIHENPELLKEAK